MNVNVISRNGHNIADVMSESVLMHDSQSALDFMMSMLYNYDCSCIILNKSALCDNFFDLKTKIAGEIVQKTVNYQIKLAIYGDFPVNESQSLRDFIYECNKGNNIFFVADKEMAVKIIST